MQRVVLGLSVAVLLLAHSIAWSAPKALAVDTLTVENEAQWVEGAVADDTPEECARFTLSPAAALRWFRAARRVSSERWAEVLSYANCSVSGSLTTRDRRRGEWRIEESGRGYVRFADGSEVFLSGLGFGRWKDDHSR
jgi:hypothetical protein